MTAHSEFAIEGTLLADGGTGLVRMKTQINTGIGELWSTLTERQLLARWYGASMVNSTLVELSRPSSRVVVGTDKAESTNATRRGIYQSRCGRTKAKSKV